MKKICSLHLKAIYNAGAVRQVDRILAVLLMAQFTRVNQMMGTDPEYQPPRIVHCHGDIWRYSPRGLENSSEAPL